MIRNFRLPHARWLLVAAVASSPNAGLAAGPVPDPADPEAPAAPIEHATPLPSGSGVYLQRVDAPRLPWTRLFGADGSFVPEPVPVGAAPSQASATSSSLPKAPAAGAAGISDSRGVIRRIDVAQGKVTLKHGPIPKMDMPGMTMVFRVKDKSLLDGLEQGDEVGFDVEIDGTTFYVTRFAK